MQFPAVCQESGVLVLLEEAPVLRAQALALALSSLLPLGGESLVWGLPST